MKNKVVARRYLAPDAPAHSPPLPRLSSGHSSSRVVLPEAKLPYVKEKSGGRRERASGIPAEVARALAEWRRFATLLVVDGRPDRK